MADYRRSDSHLFRRKSQITHGHVDMQPGPSIPPFPDKDRSAYCLGRPSVFRDCTAVFGEIQPLGNKTRDDARPTRFGAAFDGAPLEDNG